MHRMTVADTMRREWNDRAKENAYHWVVSEKQTWDQDAYYEQGRTDIARLVVPFLQSKGLSADKIRELSVLDIGCGTGRLCRALKEVCGPVTGVDISPEMIERATKENADIPGMRFVLTSGEDLSVISDASIDFCFSFIVFQHIPDKRVIRRYFEEVKRILKPGGLAKIQVRGTPGNPPGKVIWFKGFQSSYIAIALWRGWLPIPWMKPYNTVHGACYTAGELQVLLQEIGFAQVRTYHETDRYLWAEMAKGR